MGEYGWVCGGCGAELAVDGGYHKVWYIKRKHKLAAVAAVDEAEKLVATRAAAAAAASGSSNVLAKLFQR